ncbi:uncharacterized protein LOC111812792 [Octodon degus]|uniref:Uncharacterized protein LOC111812792 n=1 Tax=Octodon degus TaxID=10160 RepID=A0A6P6DCA5_OCTDE|nr:uncharacterized protein LOC111812792 [Octodon degus]
MEMHPHKSMPQSSYESHEPALPTTVFGLGSEKTKGECNREAGKDKKELPLPAVNEETKPRNTCLLPKTPPGLYLQASPSQTSVSPFASARGEGAGLRPPAPARVPPQPPGSAAAASAWAASSSHGCAGEFGRSGAVSAGRREGRGQDDWREGKGGKGGRVHRGSPRARPAAPRVLATEAEGRGDWGRRLQGAAAGRCRAAGPRIPSPGMEPSPEQLELVRGARIRTARLLLEENIGICGALLSALAPKRRQDLKEC